MCISACLCNRALVGLSGSDPSMAGFRIQGFSILLCVCVSVCVCPGGGLAAGVATAGTRPPSPLSSPSLSESTMGDPVKQYRPRNKALYRASDTLSLKREALQNADS